MKQQLRRLARRRVRVAVLDVPLLVETGAHRLGDVVVVVTAPPEVQRRRLKQRHWSDEEIARRLRAQWDLSAKVALADYIVDNGDGLEHTRRQVRGLWRRLEAGSRR